MYQELYRYFILHKELVIPGIGTFTLHSKPAVFDFPNRTMNPRAYNISLQRGNGTPSKYFFNWLSGELNISERDAVIKFNDFVFDLKRQIASGAAILWHGIGKLEKDLSGEIKFTPSEGEIIFEEPVKAEKIIREDAKHIVKVGERERSSDEMIEILQHPEPEGKRSTWWVYALVIGLLAVIFIGWFFSTYGLKISTSANQYKSVPAEMPVTHKELQ